MILAHPYRSGKAVALIGSKPMDDGLEDLGLSSHYCSMSILLGKAVQSPFRS